MAKKKTLDEKIDQGFAQINAKLKEHDQRFEKNDDKFDRLAKYILNFHDEYNKDKENFVTKDDVRNLSNAVDKFMAKVETYYQEMIMLSVKVIRIERNLEKVARKTKVKLED